jgi:hypothetical protein
MVLRGVQGAREEREEQQGQEVGRGQEVQGVML